jgi:CRP-like cAMP-binding protein
MTPAHDEAAWQAKLAALPLVRHGAGETVVAEGTKTGRLLILKSGAVSVVKGGTEIAKVAEPGAIFGELSALLGLPHTADVRAAESSEFHVADAALLLQDPAALLYVTTVLARRVDAANRALVELKGEIKAGAPPAAIAQKVGRIEALLSSIGTGFIRAGAGYAGYPFP